MRIRTIDFVGIFAALMLSGCGRINAEPMRGLTGKPQIATSNGRSVSPAVRLAEVPGLQEIKAQMDFAQVVLGNPARQSAADAPNDLSNIDCPNSASNNFDVADRLHVESLAEAVSAARRLIRQRADNPHAHHFLGVVLLADDDLLGARQSFEQALKHDPLHVKSMVSLARLDLQDGRTDVALERFEKSMSSGDAPAVLVDAYDALLRFAGLGHRAEVASLRSPLIPLPAH